MKGIIKVTNEELEGLIEEIGKKVEEVTGEESKIQVDLERVELPEKRVKSGWSELEREYKLQLNIGIKVTVGSFRLTVGKDLNIKLEGCE